MLGKALSHLPCSGSGRNMRWEERNLYSLLGINPVSTCREKPHAQQRGRWQSSSGLGGSWVTGRTQTNNQALEMLGRNHPVQWSTHSHIVTAQNPATHLCFRMLITEGEAHEIALSTLFQPISLKVLRCSVANVISSIWELRCIIGVVSLIYQRTFFCWFVFATRLPNLSFDWQTSRF